MWAQIKHQSTNVSGGRFGALGPGDAAGSGSLRGRPHGRRRGKGPRRGDGPPRRAGPPRTPPPRQCTPAPRRGAPRLPCRTPRTAAPPPARTAGGPPRGARRRPGCSACTRRQPRARTSRSSTSSRRCSGRARSPAPRTSCTRSPAGRSSSRTRRCACSSLPRTCTGNDSAQKHSFSQSLASARNNIYPQRCLALSVFVPQASSPLARSHEVDESYEMDLSLTHARARSLFPPFTLSPSHPCLSRAAHSRAPSHPLSSVSLARARAHPLPPSHHPTLSPRGTQPEQKGKHAGPLRASHLTQRVLPESVTVLVLVLKKQKHEVSSSSTCFVACLNA